MDAITLRNVTKHFGTVEAVRGIDLAVGQGEVVAFLGPNGAGKTTTIDLVLGLSRPTTGTCPPSSAVPASPCSAAWSRPSSRAAASSMT